MGADLLDLYTDYLISQTPLATATGLSKVLEAEISHDKVTRFLHTHAYGAQDLWKYVKPSVRQQESVDEGVLLLDDTGEEKTYTDENALICWHYSHAKGRHVKGVNLLSCLVRYGEVSLPIGYEVIQKDIEVCGLKTRRHTRKASFSKDELFQKLVAQAVGNHVKFRYVLADSWFGSRANLTYIHTQLNKQFIIGIKSNRLVALSREDKLNSQFQRVDLLQLEDGQATTVWLKDIAFPVQLLKKVCTNENHITGVLYLVTNDLTIEADRLYEGYQKRWHIEEFHKSIKQNASLAKSPTRVIRSQCNHIFASLIAYCKLELLKLKTPLNHFAIKYTLLVCANQMALQELQKLMAT